MIEALAKEYPVAALCQELGVARSGYYAWRRGRQAARPRANQQLAQQIEQVYRAKGGNYGSPRITQELRRQGVCCNHKRVERLMRQAGLKGRTCRRRQVRTTQSDHDQPIAPNRLLDRQPPSKVDEVWVSDITYVPTAQGWLFLAGVMDLYSRRIVGWSLRENLEAQGALQALQRALEQRDHPRGVIHHSDRGIQYACREYRQELSRSGLVASMSRKGNCYDNAAMEAFWSSLKREALEGSADWSPERVRREIFAYIEGFYNQSRLHSALGYQSPVEFEHQNQ
ncbi:MAG TPA: IS3 family transposase [Candidatus Sulfotelmatobacter sp.]|nr:IS3 family transposase [Candidatus Sulfotelmatobacter sp.]